MQYHSLSQCQQCNFFLFFFHVKPPHSMPHYYKYGHVILIGNFTFDKVHGLIDLFRKIPFAAHGLMETYKNPVYSPLISGELLLKH